MTLAALVLAVALPVLAVVPTSGPVPFEPSIVVTVAGPFVGEVCLDIDSVDGEHLYDECLPVDGVDSTAEFHVAGSTPGTYVFRPLLMSPDGEVQEGESVSVTITE